MNPAGSLSASRHGRTDGLGHAVVTRQPHEGEQKYENGLRAVAIGLLGGRLPIREITLTLAALLTATFAAPAVA